jgi:hypothetical protein
MIFFPLSLHNEIYFNKNVALEGEKPVSLKPFTAISTVADHKYAFPTKGAIW